MNTGLTLGTESTTYISLVIRPKAIPLPQAAKLNYDFCSVFELKMNRNLSAFMKFIL